jgi:hypothetical protein
MVEIYEDIIQNVTTYPYITFCDLSRPLPFFPQNVLSSSHEHPHLGHPSKSDILRRTRAAYRHGLRRPPPPLARRRNVRHVRPRVPPGDATARFARWIVSPSLAATFVDKLTYFVK